MVVAQALKSPTRSLVLEDPDLQIFSGESAVWSGQRDHGILEGLREVDDGSIALGEATLNLVCFAANNCEVWFIRNGSLVGCLLYTSPSPRDS